jgi:hypothetical protein
MKPKPFSKKHLKPSDGSTHCFTSDEQKEFGELYPDLIICGKQSEYYKCQEPLDIIKEQTNKVYDDLRHFELKFV